jgi:hypothetical protein
MSEVIAGRLAASYEIGPRQPASDAIEQRLRALGKGQEELMALVTQLWEKLNDADAKPEPLPPIADYRTLYGEKNA